MRTPTGVTSGQGVYLNVRRPNRFLWLATMPVEFPNGKFQSGPVAMLAVVAAIHSSNAAVDLKLGAMR